MAITEYETKNATDSEEYSEPFYCQGYTFKGNIDLRDEGSIHAYIHLCDNDDDDDNLIWPIVCKGQLPLLNQLGDHNHH